MANRIQVRRDTAAKWTAANPVLAAGEPALETDTGRRKTGNGTTVWTALPYVFDKTIADGIYTTPAAANAAYAPIAGSANYVAPGQLDAANAANITTPTSATAAALNAAYSPIAGVPSDYEKLLPFYAALSGRSSARCTIAQIGDSITEGAYTSDFQQASTPGRLTQILRSRFTTPGVVQGRGWIPAANWAPGGGTVPVTVSGTSVLTKSSWSPNNQTIPLSQVTHKCTVTLTGTSFDLNYVTYASSGVGYYTIDGGTPVTFNAVSTSTVGNATTRVALTAGSHTIVVGWSSGGQVYFNGFTEYNQDETAGINVCRFGLSGSDTADWLAASGLAASTATFSPSLIIIQHGTNDANVAYGNLTAAQYKTNLLAVITSLRGAFTVPPPIVLSLVYQPSSTAITTNQPWADYAAAAKAIADSDSAVIFIDHSARMPAGNAAHTYGLYYGDGIHPSDRGYDYLAETFAAVIAPR